MRNRIKLGTAAILAIGVALIVCSTPAVAQAACEQDCQDRFDSDVQACEDALAEKLANLAADQADCVAQAPSSPNGAKGCFTSVNKRRRNAQKQYSQCLRRADTKLRNCLRQCDASPSGDG